METGSIQAHKRQIRRAMLAARRNLPEAEWLVRSRQAAEQLTALPCYQHARVMLCYMAFDKEVMTEGLIRQALAAGKRVVLPIVQAERHSLVLGEIHDMARDVVPGYRGILEPRPAGRRLVTVDALELVIVPGVAFDVQGGRLGFGTGFYDRLFSGLPRHIPRLGMAFDFQVVLRLPRQSHDLVLDGIVTESRVLWCGASRRNDGAAMAARSAYEHVPGGRGERPWRKPTS